MLRGHIIGVPIFALVLVAGCGTGDPSLDDLDASVTAMTREDVTRVSGDEGGVSTAIELDKGYSSALQTAILENQRLSSAVRRFRAAEANIGIPQSAARPQITASVTGGGFAETDVDDNLDFTTGAVSDVSVSQLIFDGGGTRADIAGATAQAYASRANVVATGNEVGRNAAIAWIDLWQAKAQLALLRKRLSEVAPTIERIERLIASGIVDRAALAAAQRQFLDLELEEERQEFALQDARERFNRYYRNRPESVAAPQRLFSNEEVAQLARIWQDSPALISAAAEVIVAERALEGAQAENLPTLRARAGVNSPLSDTDDAEGNVGLVLEHTFGDGGRRRANIERLDNRLQATRAAFEDTKSEAQVQAETTLSRHRSLRRTIPVLEAQIEALDTERTTLRSQITSGQAQLRELVESEVLHYRAQARLIQIRGELSKLEIGLASQTGRLTQKLGIGMETLLSRTGQGTP